MQTEFAQAHWLQEMGASKERIALYGGSLTPQKSVPVKGSTIKSSYVQIVEQFTNQAP